MAITVTLDTILNWFEKSVEEKTPVPPSVWLDGASKLNALLGNLDDDLAGLEMDYRAVKVCFLEEGKSAAESEARAKASEAYRAYLKTKAKRERVIEFIRLAKKRTEVPGWDQ